MKHNIITTLLATLAIATVGYSQVDPAAVEAEEAEEASNGLFDNISVGSFGYLITDDFDEIDEEGFGFKAGYQITEGLGADTEVFINSDDIDGNDIEGSTIDKQAFNVNFTAKITDQFTAIPFGGLVRNYEDSIWGFNVGLRFNVNLYKDSLSASAGGRWLKEDERDDTALFDVAVGYRF